MLRDLVCAACKQHLGQVHEHQADHLGWLHAPKCTASVAEYDQALAAVKHAQRTGDTTELDDAMKETKRHA